MHQLRIFINESNKIIDISTNNNRHDELSEVDDIETTKYEEELPE